MSLISLSIHMFLIEADCGGNTVEGKIYNLIGADGEEYLSG